MKLVELAQRIKGELVGDGKIEVTAIKDIGEAGERDLAFLLDARGAKLLEKTMASCVVVPMEINKANCAIIRTKNPALAFKQTVEVMLPARIPRPKGVHKTACLGKGVTLGRNVGIGAYAVIEDGAGLGDNVLVYPMSYIGHGTKIGEDSVIYPNVTIREGITIGKRVIIHPGAVIGADGFGYQREGLKHQKIPQIGDVIIEDDVEIGACAAVDRAKFAHTRIGRGTKIDNLVQIAHNCVIGENCIIVGQVGLSGSVKLGNNVMLGGQVGIVDHVELGDNVMVGAKSGITKNIPPNTIMWGSLTAISIQKHKKRLGYINMLPKLYERVRKLEKEINRK